MHTCFYELGTEQDSELWAIDGGMIPQRIRESTTGIEEHQNTPAGLFFMEQAELWASDGTSSGTIAIDINGFVELDQLRNSNNQTFFVANPDDGTIQLWNAETVFAFSVDAGAGYVLPEGETLQLRPTASGAVGTVTFDWDLDDDGDFDDYTAESAFRSAGPMGHD